MIRQKSHSKLNIIKSLKKKFKKHLCYAKTVKFAQWLKNKALRINRGKAYLIFGLTTITVSLTGLLLLFSNVIMIELTYQLKKKNISKNEEKSQVALPVVPVDSNFSVIIPKIDVNAKVISNIDPFSREEYLEALSKGVAHAKGTSFPDQKGNTFIFAHSTTDNILDVNRYNAIFYLLGKLERGSLIYLVYKGKNYQYKVSQIKIINVDRVEFIDGNSDDETLTLMTCWPPGTTLKRLLIIAAKT